MALRVTKRNEDTWSSGAGAPAGGGSRPQRSAPSPLRATKRNEDTRSSGAGAPARGPAPSPVHRP